MIVDTIRPRLNTLIEQAFRLYEVEQQKVVFAANRPVYARAFYDFFLDIFNRLGDAIFLESFYSITIELYTLTGSGENFVSEIIRKFLEILDSQTAILYEMSYNGQKNSFDLIINYCLNLLSSQENLSKIDSSILLRLIDHYDSYVYDRLPQRVYLKRPDRPLGRGSRFFKKRFDDVHRDKVYEIASQVINSSAKINRAISDSAEYLEDTIFQTPLDDGILRRSWGGEGDSIYKSCRDVHSLSKRLGRTEDSKASEVEFAEKVIRLVKAASFGANFNYPEFIINSQNFFGRFNTIYTVGETESREIYGLGFLEPLALTRSLQSATPGLDPIRALFSSGIKNRLGHDDNKLGHNLRNKIAPLSLYFSSALRKARNIGWNVLSIERALDDNGRLRGYEGLGSLKYPLDALCHIFPTQFRSRNSGIFGGLTGALDFITRGIASIEENINEGAVPSQTLESMVPWLNQIKSKIEIIVSIIETVGYKSGDIIPNIPINVTSRTRKDFQEYFSRSGYNHSETEKILSSKNIRELIDNFSNKMTYADVRSFVGCYDLCSLVYSIGGEAGLQQVLEYLYEPNSEGFARLYEILEKRQSKFIKLDSFKYGKLIGSLYSVLRLTNSAQVENLKKYLRGKNSTIGESLKIVAELGLIDPLKDATQVDMITPLIDQSSWGTTSGGDSVILDSNYSLALKNAPFELREWSGLIKNSAGFANQQDLILLLNSMSGVTYDQLISILRLDSNPGLSVLSGILDGARGGQFTRLLRDFYMSGLALLSRDYHSSARSGNSTVGKNDFYMVDLVENMRRLTVDLDLAMYRLVTSTSRTFSINNVDSRENTNVSQDIVNSLNKPIESISNYILSLRLDSQGDLPYKYNSSAIRRTLEENGLSEPPGIGNSPRFLRRFKPNTLTPELAFLLSNQSNTQSITTLNSKYNLSAQSYIKISRANLEWKEPTNVPEKLELENALSTDPYTLDLQPNFLTSSSRPVFSTYVRPAPFPEINSYVESTINKSLTTPVQGTYGIDYIDEEDPTDFIDYDPVRTCEEFGTSRSKCKELFKDYQRVSCAEYRYNRSSLVEDNLIYEPQQASSVVIDRPLGYGGAPNPSSVFLPNFYKEPPSYISGGSGIDKDGEPFGDYTLNELDIAQSNTALSLKEYINKYGFPIDERDCSRKSDIANLNKCLNALLCQKIPEKNRPKVCLGTYTVQENV